MKKYNIEVKETRIIEVCGIEAESFEKAKEIAVRNIQTNSEEFDFNYKHEEYEVKGGRR